MAEQQRFTALDSTVIDQARRKRLDTIVLRRDRSWLRKLSGNPAALLQRMARHGALVPLGGGRYAIAEIGARSSAMSTTWQVVLDADLSPLGPYYLGFMSALEDHRLTDLDEPDITVAIGFHNDRLERGRETIFRRPLRITTMQPKAFASGIETVHQSRNRRYRRSDVERTLVDCHERPRLVASVEVWIRAWARAFREERVNVDRLLEHSQRQGVSAMRRTAVLLSLLGYGVEARETFRGRARRADRVVPFIAGRDVPTGADVDSYWRVAWNIPSETIEGWLAYER